MRSRPLRGAAAYGRTGSCLGRFGTLVAYLLDALNVVTGNLDRPGGAVFGSPPIALDEIGEKAGLATYGKIRSRIGGYPDVIGNLPATLLPQEIDDAREGTDPRVLRVGRQSGALGPGRQCARECVRRARPDGVARLLRERDQPPRRLRAAGDDLPRARGHPVAFLGLFSTPFIQVTKPVVPPAGEARRNGR